MADSSPQADETLTRLRESEELYSRAFMSNPIPMTVTDGSSGRFTHVNPAFCQLVGFPRAELMGHTSEELQLWTDRTRRGQIEERIAQDDEMPLVRGFVRTKAGTDVPVLASFRMLTVAERAVVLSVLVPIRD